jgi:pantoate--beta-alanine ligase
MGALHLGHRALLRLAREISGPGGSVVVSIFVNPLQFGAGEDFGRYPRALDQDLAVCGEEGAALVFAPAGDVMYPAPPQVTVDPGLVGRLL